MSPDPLQKARIWFLIRFGVIVAVLYAAIAWNPVNDRVIVPFTQKITAAAGWMASLVEGPLRVSGTIISNPTFAVDVKNGCNGVEAMILLLAAMAAFPAPWKARLFGIGAGFLAIQFVNTFRVAFLFWLGVHHRNVFDLFHVAVWQTLIILFSVALFMVWSWKFGAPRDVAESR